MCVGAKGDCFPRQTLKPCRGRNDTWVLTCSSFRDIFIILYKNHRWRVFAVKSRFLSYLFIFTFLLIICTFLSTRGALAADRYTVNSTLRHNPGVNAAQLDSFVRDTYPFSPLVGLGQTWVNLGTKYNIDPVFLMSHAILESGWGFSWISQNKKNIYGWGAYDRDPEGMAESFNTYEAGVEYVVAHINSMYLAPGGDYYTIYGPTLRGMNVNYATSETWADNIASIMNDFASRLPGYKYPPPFREYDALYKKIDIPSLMQPGLTYQIAVKVDNSGDATWTKDGPFKLTYTIVDAEGKSVGTGQVIMPSDVQSGSSVFLSFPITSPATPGAYVLKLDMLREGVTTFSAKDVATLDTVINVVPDSPYYKVSFVNTTSIPETAYAGTVYPVATTISNASATYWPAIQTSLSYQWINAQTGESILSEVAVPNLDKSLFPSDTSPVQFETRTPTQPGFYIFKLDLIDNHSIQFSSKGATTVTTLVQILPDFGATYKLIGEIEPFYALTPKLVNINLVNTSKMTWPENGMVRLSYSFTDIGGHQGYTARIPMPQDVSPGENVTIEAPIVPPNLAGQYILTFDLIFENLSWFSQQNVPIFSTPVTVVYDLNASYFNVDVGTPLAGLTTEADVTLTNISKMMWPANGPVKLSYSFSDTGAHQGYEARIPISEDIQPGETATLTVPLANPSTPGVYNLRFDLIDERAGWFSQHGVTIASRAVHVLPPYEASYKWVTIFPQMQAGTTATILVSLINAGHATWPAGGDVSLSYSFADTGAHQGYDARITMPQTVAPGDSVDLTVPLSVPSTPGYYTLKFDLIAEGIGWFTQQGVPEKSTVIEIINQPADQSSVSIL